MLNDVRGRWKVSSRHSDRRNLLFPPDCDSTGFSRGKIKDTYQRLQDLLRRANQPDILILTGDNNARMGWLPSNDEHLKSRLVLKFWPYPYMILPIIPLLNITSSTGTCPDHVAAQGYYARFQWFQRPSWHIQCSLIVPADRTDNESLIQVCSHHRLSLINIDFRLTWRPPSNSQRWIQIGHAAIGRYPARIKDRPKSEC